MADIDIYTTPGCPYCMRAKALLKRKDVTWHEIDVSENEARREEMITRAEGRRSVPQIFINGQYIGGCDDLYALDREGKLDPMLGTMS